MLVREQAGGVHAFGLITVIMMEQWRMLLGVDFIGNAATRRGVPDGDGRNDDNGEGGDHRARLLQIGRAHV